MVSHLDHSHERSWQVSLYGYLDVTRASTAFSALDVDDAERQAMRSGQHGLWSVSADDRQSLHVDTDKFFVDRYVTHCTQQGSREWICGLAARILVGCTKSVLARSAQEAEQLALAGSMQGTWAVGGHAYRDNCTIEVSDSSMLSGLHAIVAATGLIA